MFETKVVDKLIAIYFTVAAFMMYYFINEQIYVPVGITYRHLFALLIVISAFVLFLIKPRIDEIVVSVKSAFMFAMPLLVVLVASMLVWILDKSDLSTINRGISGCFFYTNWLSCALAAVSMLYVFGEDGIWYNLVALVSANLLMIIQIMTSNGVGEYMKEFFELVFSFAGNTGDVIVKAEIHELAFCMGAYLLYMLFKPKRKAWFWVLFGLAAFCFVSALKRIAVIAIAAAFLIRLILLLVSKFSKKAVKGGVTFVMLLSVVILVAYIAVIKADVFTMMEKGGIDTSGRADIYSWASKFYEFSPSFYGKGIGFVTHNLSNDITVGVSAVHNDFLQFFIDLGFVGYVLWLLSMTVLRTSYFGRHGDTETATLCCMLMVYLEICSSTDNTVNYPLLTTVMAIIIIGNQYQHKVDAQKEISKFKPIGGRI